MVHKLLRPVLSLLFLLAALDGNGQTTNDVFALYVQHRYDEATRLGREILPNDTSAQLCMVIGRAYVDNGKPDSAVSYLELAISLDNDQGWVSCWAHGYLGTAYFGLKQKEEGETQLRKAVKHIGATQHATRYAEHQMAIYHVLSTVDTPKTGAEEIKWVIVPAKNITYKFQDTSGWSGQIPKYIEDHEKAYEKINAVFCAKLPSKLEFNVWSDVKLADHVLHRSLGFTLPRECICHAHRTQTLGHEMTHALSYWAWDRQPEIQTKFINEGIAVAFDLSRRNLFTLAKEALAGKRIRNVTEIWANSDASDELVYPVGGAFITYLYGLGLQEQFRQLVKHQTINDAAIIYGKDRFANLVKDFNARLGLK